MRLDGGCTGSFISGDGLILTNHHCAEDCIVQNSSEGNDLNTNGFLAGTREKELQCKEDSLSVLVGTEDVTAKVAARTPGRRPRQGRRGPARGADADGAGLRGRLEEGQGRRAQVRGA